MDIHFTATGTPGNSEQNLAKQFKALRESDPSAWPATVAGLRDDVARAIKRKEQEIRAALPEDRRESARVDVQVDVDLKLDIRITELTAKGVIEAFNAGEPLPGVPVAAAAGEFKARRRSDANLTEMPGAPGFGKE